MIRFLEWVERRFAWIAAATLLALAILAAYLIIDSLPPREFTILTGREGAGYYRAAQEYRLIAAKQGFNLIIRPTSGSIETLAMLEEGEASIGFVQGGITSGADPDVLRTLIGVFYEPVWIFYQREFGGPEKLVHLYQLAGGRINLGEHDSGASYLSRQLLEANGVTANNSTFYELPADEAAAQLLEGRLDAAIFVVSANSDTILTLARSTALDLMDVERAAAYRARFPYLTTVTLPQGTVDLVAGLPSEDKHLIATAANLIVRNDFHPDLMRLMTIAAVDTHEDGGFYEQRFEFPNFDHADLPVGREQRASLERIKTGETTLRDNLPYWAIRLLDNYLLFLIPILFLLLVLFIRSGILFDFFNRRKVDKSYDILRRIDLRASKMSAAELTDALAVLDSMERDLVERSVLYERHRPVFNDLRHQIGLVRERLELRRGSVKG